MCAHLTSGSVIAMGRLNDPALCRRLIEEEKTDMVALGRQALADPDFAIKALMGRENEINRCTYCDAQGYYLPKEDEPGFPKLQHNPAYAVDLLAETKLKEIVANIALGL